jgi:hypothetical protein
MLNQRSTFSTITTLSILTAIYNWPGEIQYGLPLEIGDTVQIFEECLGKKHNA